MKSISVGLIGCGRNSENHLRVFSNMDGAKLVAVCDIDAAKVKEKARKYGAQKAFTDVDSMLNMELDLVNIVTPPSTHAQLSVLALESGHNVLVEKPMAVTSKECQHMISAAHKTGKTLCVMHNKRFFDSIIQTKTVVDRERLKVSRMNVSHFFVTANEPVWITNEASGGILWEALIHQVYLTQYFLGQTQSVYAVADKAKRSIYDSFTLVLRSHGKAGICQFQWDMKEPLTSFRVITEQGDRFEGDLSLDFVIRKSRTYKNQTTTAWRTFSDDLSKPLIKWKGVVKNFLKTGSYEKSLPYEKTFFVLIRQMISFLAGERSSPPVPAEEGLQAIRVLEAAKKSIETGNVQSLE